MSTTIDTASATEITLIQIGRRALGLDDVTYRTMLSNLAGGKTSSKALTAAERQTVLTHMKARGFVVKPRAGTEPDTWPHEPKMRKLRAMWYVLADAGEVARPFNKAACTAAVDAWAQRQMSRWPNAPTRLRFASGAQMAKLIEECKAWLQRLGLPVA